MGDPLQSSVLVATFVVHHQSYCRYLPRYIYLAGSLDRCAVGRRYEIVLLCRSTSSTMVRPGVRSSTESSTGFLISQCRDSFRIVELRGRLKRKRTYFFGEYPISLSICSFSLVQSSSPWQLNLVGRQRQL